VSDALEAEVSDVEQQLTDLVAKIAATGVKSFPPIRIFKNKFVPLARYDAETGVAEDALFWKIDGDIHVHPDRWDQFVECLTAAGAEMP